MRPSLVYAAALLMVVTAVTAPVGAVAEDGPSAQSGHLPEVASVDGFANYLAIPDADVRASTMGETSIDVSTAAATDTARLNAEYDRLAFEREFGAAEDEEERVAVVRDYVGETERRHERLKERRDEAIRAHSNGSIRTDQFVRSMARIDANARDLRATVVVIDEQVARSGVSLPDSLNDRLNNLREELVVMSGPVSQRIAESAEGDSDVRSVYVETSTTGYTLAVIEGNTYYRETYLGDERNESAVDQFRASDQYVVTATNERGLELYPWLGNQTDPFGRGLGETSIYLFRGDYDGGQLRAYLDGGTTNVFREHQEQRIDAVPVTDVRTFTNGDVRVQVERTYQTGPMRMTITDSRTGEPVPGTVSINGVQVGHTGSDGVIWTVEPRSGVPWTVVTDDGQRVGDRLPA